MDSVQRVARSAARFFSGTMFSRATGFLRDVTTAAMFGGNPKVAAFLMAYRFANLPRRLFGEGAMHSAFIPHYEKEGREFAKGVMVLLALFLIAIVLIAEPFFLFSRSEVIRFTGIMLPVVVFLCLYGLNQALLNCHDIYFLPSFAPGVFNLIWIAGVLIWKNLTALAIVVVCADAVQWLVTLPTALRLLKGVKMNFAKIRPFTRSLFLAMLGVGATQINSALDPIFARIADPSGPAYLWYALRIQQLPLALFGIALVNALLPTLTRTDNPAPFMRYAYKWTLLLMIPTTVALCTLPLVKLIYAHGAFSELAVQKTTLCLQAYALGLLPQSLVMIRSAAFYAHGDYRTPAIISAFAVVVNIVLNSIFVFFLHWGPASIALATALSSVVQYGIQRWHYSQLEWN